MFKEVELPRGCTSNQNFLSRTERLITAPIALTPEKWAKKYGEREEKAYQSFTSNIWRVIADYNSRKIRDQLDVLNPDIDLSNLQLLSQGYKELKSGQIPFVTSNWLQMEFTDKSTLAYGGDLGFEISTYSALGGLRLFTGRTLCILLNLDVRFKNGQITVNQVIDSVNALLMAKIKTLEAEKEGRLSGYLNIQELEQGLQWVHFGIR